MTCPTCQRPLAPHRFGSELRAYCEGCGAVIVDMAPEPALQPIEQPTAAERKRRAAQRAKAKDRALRRGR